jgi:hypothetical protein
MSSFCSGGSSEVVLAPFRVPLSCQLAAEVQRTDQSQRGTNMTWCAIVNGPMVLGARAVAAALCSNLLI